MGANELLVIFAAGVISLALERATIWRNLSALVPVISWRVIAGTTVVAVPVASAFSLTKLFLFFLKVGSVLFGSGYVLLAFLRTDLVDRFHWLTESQLIDAVAIGQFTPGPVFTTATFIGYLLAGPRGAFLATVGIFLPAFFFVALTAPFMSKLRKSKPLGAALDGLNVASLAVMSVTTLVLARSTITDWLTASLAAAAGVLLIRYKINSAWLVLAGGAIGFFYYR
jgi:chromate transporter